MAESENVGRVSEAKDDFLKEGLLCFCQENLGHGGDVEHGKEVFGERDGENGASMDGSVHSSEGDGGRGQFELLYTFRPWDAKSAAAGLPLCASQTRPGKKN